MATHKLRMIGQMGPTWWPSCSCGWYSEPDRFSDEDEAQAAILPHMIETGVHEYEDDHTRDTIKWQPPVEEKKRVKGFSRALEEE